MSTSSKDDFRNYELHELDKKFQAGGVSAMDWTIDRERSSYLKQLTRGREESFHISEWIFLWREHLHLFEMHSLSASGPRGGAGYAHIRIEKLRFLEDRFLTPSPIPNKEELIKDLREALQVSRGGSGVYSTYTSFEMDLEIE